MSDFHNDTTISYIDIITCNSDSLLKLLESVSSKLSFQIILIKNGGEKLLQCLHFLFQKWWAAGELCEALKIDPKVLLPKPDKEKYNNV